MQEIKHKFNGGQATYNSDGLYLKPFFSTKSIFIEWKNIEFFSTTPGVRNELNEWKTFDGINIMQDDSLTKLKYFIVEVGLLNRKLIFKDVNWLFKIWAHFYLTLKPLWNADDKPDKVRGLITLEIKKHSLTSPLKELLQLIEQKSKYDIVAHLD